jgi:hypothetical protein
MFGKWGLASLVSLVAVAAATAQTPAWRFHWRPGQVLTYRVDQVTSAIEEAEGKKTEATSKMSNVKSWKVVEVDAKGTATLQLSLLSLRLETTTPNGEVLLFDSANQQQSTPQLREQLSKFVGQTLAILRVNVQGKVVQVKESKFGPAGGYDSEPPFVLTLPDGGPQKTWERSYKITLPPPQGTNDQFDAQRKYEVTKYTDKSMTVTLATALKSPPAAAADQIPLLQMQPEGEVVFNLQTGLLESARLLVNKEVKGHRGEGSSYKFRSNYTEQLVPNQN